MENSRNTINLSQIAYPVFKIPGSNIPTTEGGVTFIYSEVREDDELENFSFKVIDDKNIDKPTLGLRRLQIQARGQTLHRLGKAIFFLGDLVKIATRHAYFIDSHGRIFQYKKSQRAKLTFNKIRNVIPIPTGGAILEIEGIPSRVKCLFAPRQFDLYAGMLQFGMSFILYGLYEQRYKDSWRMV